MKGHLKWEDIDRVVGDKIKEHSEITKFSEEAISVCSPSEENISIIKKEL